MTKRLSRALLLAMGLLLADAPVLCQRLGGGSATAEQHNRNSVTTRFRGSEWAVRLRVTGIMAMVVVLAAVSVSCSLRLAVVPASDVPSQIVESLPKWMPTGASEVTWRSVYQQEGYDFAVVTYTMGGTLFGDPRNVLWIGTPASDGIDVVYPFINYPWESSRYSWKTGHFQTPTGMYQFYACGYTSDKDAAKVVGTTNAGRTFEASLTNGFWTLLVPEHFGGEGFEQVALQNQQGETIFTYRLADEA